MKHLLRTIILLAAATAALVTPSCQSGSKAELRLMSYNVRNCRGLDDSVSFERVARIINDAAPDIVAVQELDSMTTRNPGQDVLGNLATQTGMYPTFAPSIDFAGGKYGHRHALARERCRTAACPCRAVRSRDRCSSSSSRTATTAARTCRSMPRTASPTYSS